MKDYEYDFCMLLHSKLKERIYGKIHVSVSDEDNLCIHITRHDGFDYYREFNRFSDIFFNGHTTDTIANVIMKEIKKYILSMYLK